MGFWNSSYLLEPPCKCLLEDPNIPSLKILAIVDPIGRSILLLRTCLPFLGGERVGVGFYYF